MTDTIRAALTPEEWAEALDGQAGSLTVAMFRATGNNPSLITQVAYGSPHKLAALCLHGQPYGFTQADVTELRGLAMLYASVSRLALMGAHPESHGLTEVERREAWADSLASRLAALLPPSVDLLHAQEGLL